MSALNIHQSSNYKCTHSLRIDLWSHGSWTSWRE